MSKRIDMKKPLCILAGLFCIAQGVIAQELRDSTGVEHLEEVTVTDARIPLRWAESGKAVARLDRADLESYQGATVAENRT